MDIDAGWEPFGFVCFSICNFFGGVDNLANPTQHAVAKMKHNVEGFRRSSRFLEYSCNHRDKIKAFVLLFAPLRQREGFRILLGIDVVRFRFGVRDKLPQPTIRKFSFFRIALDIIQVIGQ